MGDDLFYRLNVVPIYLPPLRERRSDIPLLAEHFLEQYCEENRFEPPKLPDWLVERLQTYQWPGNVRELENYVERAAVLSQSDQFNFDALVPQNHSNHMRPARAADNSVESLIQNVVRTALQTLPPDEGNLHDRVVGGVERELLEQVLRLCDNVRVKAAARLGINRNTLQKKLSEMDEVE